MKSLNQQPKLNLLKPLENTEINICQLHLFYRTTRTSEKIPEEKDSISENHQK